MPAWIHAQWEATQAKTITGDLVRQIFERRVHWIQYLGIALGLIGAFFAVKNYFFATQLDRSEERGVGFLARLLARFLD